MTDNQPLILAYCCHYCAYAAADLAGSMRLEYPDNVRVLRLPCTGKIEVDYILAAFERGVDGVIVAGCLEGGCHFIEGNLRARRRVERAKRLLEDYRKAERKLPELSGRRKHSALKAKQAADAAVRDLAGKRL